MASESVSLGQRILDAWGTNAYVTRALVSSIPEALWTSAIPGVPRRTVRMMGAHLHNSRRAWTRTLGAPHGVTVCEPVDPRRATRAQVVRALVQSARGIESILKLGLENDGVVPPTRTYIWRNLPLDVGHILAYFVAHEGHHRGQLVLVARQLGLRLPAHVTNALWQWSGVVRELKG